MAASYNQRDSRLDDRSIQQQQQSNPTTSPNNFPLRNIRRQDRRTSLNDDKGGANILKSIVKEDLLAHRRRSAESRVKQPLDQEPPAIQAPATRDVPPRRANSTEGKRQQLCTKSHLLRANYLDLTHLYYFHEELGRGASGIVRRCTDKLTGQSHACKTLFKAEIKCQLDVEGLKAEVNAMLAMQCEPSVVRLRGVFEDSMCVHLVMEYCQGGDLFNRIKSKGHYSEAEAALVVKQLASVLDSAHARGIMHRDLKPENILLVSKDSDTDICLADFGSAAFFRPGQRLNQLIGSPLYISPAVLHHNYGAEADLWSLGVILYILLSGVPPFWGRTNVEIFHSIQNAPLNLERGRIGEVSREAKDLIRNLLNRNSSSSVSAAFVLGHPWVCNHTRGREQQAPMIVSRSRITFSSTGKIHTEEPMPVRKYMINTRIPIRGSRRRSVGAFQEDQIESVAETPSSQPLKEVLTKSVLQRTATPFRRSSIGMDGGEADDEESVNDGDCSFDDDDRDVYVSQQDDEGVDSKRPRQRTQAEIEQSTSGKEESDNDSDIPIAETVEDEDNLVSDMLQKFKKSFIPVVRRGQKVRRSPSMETSA